MKGFTAVTVLVTVALAGCGGGGPDGPSAKEKRAALDKWTRTADAACEKANKSIAERGWPVNLVDLDRLTVRALADVEAAYKTIRAQKAPVGSEDKVRPFVKSLEELDAKTKELSSATERFKLAKLDKFLPEFGGTLQHVETASKELGLRECASHQEHVFLPDAIRAPVFAQQLANLDRRLTKRAKKIDNNVSTPKAIAQNLREVADLADVYARRLDDLKPPYWARRESDNYVTALRSLSTVFDKSAKRLGTPITSMAEANRLDANISRAYRTERKAIKKLLKGIGAIPTVPGGDGGDGGDAPSEDEAQEA